MSTRYAAFQITGSTDEAAQARLADAAQFITDPATIDALDINSFAHLYDPELARAWLTYALNPTLNGLPVRTGPQVMPTAVAVNPTTGQRSAAPVAPVPITAGQHLANSINNLNAADQTRVALDTIGAVLNALKAFNISLLSINEYRRLAERLWGYFQLARGGDIASNQYWVGIPSDAIAERTQTALGTMGEWRTELARQWRVAFPNFRYQFSAVEVLFGTRDDYQDWPVGCRIGRVERDTEVQNYVPNACDRPTGECHSVWVQQNNAIYGGRLYTPLELSRLFDTFHNEDILHEQFNWCPDQPHYRWGAPCFNARTPSVGRWRLHVVPPLAWYWGMFFLPQPEFADAHGTPLSLVDWLLSMTPEELIRRTRRGATQRNGQMADFYQVTVNQLIGQAQVDLSREQQRTARTNQRDASIPGSLSSGLGQISPIAGLIAGLGSIVTQVILSGSNHPLVHIDVLGQLMPAFVQPYVYASRTGFDGAMRDQVGWPRGMGPNATVAQPAAPSATTNRPGFMLSVPMDLQFGGASAPTVSTPMTAAPARGAKASPGAAGTTPGQTGGAPGAAGGGKWKWALGLGAVGVAVGAGVWYSKKSSSRQGTEQRKSR